MTHNKNRFITCLSISQPFAELILSNKKTIELRTWNTKFRGKFFIHSPIKIRKDDCKRLNIDCCKLVTGAIIGYSNIVDVFKYQSTIHMLEDHQKHFADRIYEKNPYGFVLENSKRLRVPIPYKGMLGFFKATIHKPVISSKNIESEIIDEEFRYQWIGRH